MAIIRGELAGNPAKLVAFINESTQTTKISAELKLEGSSLNILIYCPVSPESETLTRIAQINGVNEQDNTNGSYILYGGGSVEWSRRALPSIGYRTSKGFLFILSPNNGQAQGYIISKTNNGYYGNVIQEYSGEQPFSRVAAQAVGDKSGANTTTTVMFPQHSGTTSWSQDAYAKDQIQLVPIPTRGNGVISYFQNAFWIPNSPTRQYGIVQIGDKKYAMSSYMALED
jgi:hypothetical protein